MVDLDPDAIRVANTGQIVTGGVTIPALTPDQTTLTTFAAPWVGLGLFTEDGVEHEFSEDVEKLVTWQSGVVKYIVKGRELMLKIAAVESSPAVLEAYYGAPFVEVGEVGDEVGRLSITNTQPRPVAKWVYEWQDQDTGAIWRLVFERGQIGEVESPTFNSQGAVMWGMTATALGGASGSVMAYWETNDPTILASLA